MPSPFELDAKLYRPTVTNVRREAKSMAAALGVTDTYGADVKHLLGMLDKKPTKRSWLALHMISMSLLEFQTGDYVAVKGMLLCARAMFTDTWTARTIHVAYTALFPSCQPAQVDGIPPSLVKAVGAALSFLTGKEVMPGQLTEVDTPFGKLKGVAFDLKSGKKAPVKMPPGDPRNN